MNKIISLISMIFLLTSCSLLGDFSNNGRLVHQYGGKKTKPDYAFQKSIIISRYGTKEILNVVYYKNNRYVPSALRKINKIFRDRMTGKIGSIDPELIDFMVDIRSRLGLPKIVVFEVMSGYRSRKSNKRQRKTNKQMAKNSYHLRGWAVDFKIKHVSGKAIAEIAKTMQRGGVSYYPSSNHVHIDLGKIRSWRPK